MAEIAEMLGLSGVLGAFPAWIAEAITAENTVSGEPVYMAHASALFRSCKYYAHAAIFNLPSY